MMKLDEDIYSYVDYLLKSFPTVSKPFSLGYTYEKREIRGVS